MASAKLAGVERAEGLTRSMYPDKRGYLRGSTRVSSVSSSQSTQLPRVRAIWASTHADNMLDDAPAAADLISFY